MTAIHQPQTLHEDLVFLGDGKVEGKVFSVIWPALEAVVVEKNVVEDGQFVGNGESAVANLLMKLLQGIFAGRRIRLGCIESQKSIESFKACLAVLFSAGVHAQLTIGDAECLQDAIDEQSAIELLPHNLDVLYELGIAIG